MIWWKKSLGIVLRYNWLRNVVDWMILFSWGDPECISDTFPTFGYIYFFCLHYSTWGWKREKKIVLAFRRTLSFFEYLPRRCNGNTWLQYCVVAFSTGNSYFVDRSCSGVVCPWKRNCFRSPFTTRQHSPVFKHRVKLSPPEQRNIGHKSPQIDLLKQSVRDIDCVILIVCARGESLSLFRMTDSLTNFFSVYREEILTCPSTS